MFFIFIKRKMSTRTELMKDFVSKIENGVFVEIGTHHGNFAYEILKVRNDSILYCIDPYCSYNDYKDAINNEIGDNLFEKTKSRLISEFGESRVKFIRKYSDEAIHDIPDNIDFLYIDGNHQYKYVKKDLELYFSKVKKGGVIMGDDAVDTDDSRRNEEGDVFISWNGVESYGNYGVVKAFREFVVGKDIRFSFLTANQYIILK